MSPPREFYNNGSHQYQPSYSIAHAESFNIKKFLMLLVLQHFLVESILKEKLIQSLRLGIILTLCYNGQFMIHN